MNKELVKELIKELDYVESLTPETRKYIKQYVHELEEENKNLKNLFGKIKNYILKEMYVDRCAVAGWLQFDNLLKMLDEVIIK